MELSRQRDLAESFDVWYGTALKATVEDNRRRYRMELSDSSERQSRKLSVLPSVKSTSIVDGYVDRAIQEYHQDPESLSYTAKSRGHLTKDAECRWLTEIVRYRMARTFRFFTWHRKSLKVGAVDGIEAALLSWKHERKPNKVKQYSYTSPEGQSKQVSKEEYDQYGKMIDGYSCKTVDQPIVVRDTWWIDLLMPGRDICWDPKAPLFDINLGQFALVKLKMSLSEIKNHQANKTFDSVDIEKIKNFQTTATNQYSDATTTATNPESVDFDDLNPVEVWMFFDRTDNEWGIQFSVEGELSLSSRKPVNDVFFNGREVNCLPIALGYSDDELWENVGRGLPKIIAPLEDEASDHRNNFNDYAKQLLRGKHWVAPDSDVDVDQLINMPVVYGREGIDFGQVSMPQGSLDVLRAAEGLNGDMNSLVPVDLAGMGGRVVAKGMEATLGTVQMSQSQTDSKLGVRLMTRNETFFSQVMYLIAQLEFAWETDESIARYAASKVALPAPPNAPPGMPPPQFQPPMDGALVDFRRLDFDFDVQINAGLGAVPLQQKAQSLIQISEWRKANGMPTDIAAIGKQLNVLTGYEADAFTPAQPMPDKSPPVDYKATINIDLEQLLQVQPQAALALLQKLLSGQMDTTAKVNSKNPNAEAQQNGGGLYTPNRTGQQVSGTDEAAMRMSQGGMNGSTGGQTQG